MNNNNKLHLSLLAAAAVMIGCTLGASAQVNYYQTPAYQAEEQAFRARQNEGARLYEMYGQNSAPYLNWAVREKGLSPSYANPYNLYQQYYPYSNSFMYWY